MTCVTNCCGLLNKRLQSAYEAAADRGLGVGTHTESLEPATAELAMGRLSPGVVALPVHPCIMGKA